VIRSENILRVCFIVGEIFHWGTYGGFGALTRTIGQNLVKQGIEVYVLMLYETKKKHRIIENLDGMTVISLPSRRNRSFYKACDADIYHSEDASSGSHYAMKAMPDRKHVITFQDPMYYEELVLSQLAFHSNWSNPFYRLKQKLRWKAGDYLVGKAVHKAAGLFSQAKFVIPKITSMYGLKKSAEFLPNPVEVPKRPLKKADKPTVCFLGRWEPVKRVEDFMELAKSFPDVRFIATGKAHNEERDQFLRKKYSDVPNLEMPEWVFGEEKSKILEESWILINPSIRECLPVSFLEAAAYECAILSSNNPDEFAEKFGYHVKDNNFAKGLKFLLENDEWKERGRLGRKYVEEEHELGKVLQQHTEIYERILET
jgi:glycosyltransferase involved in cell wall biosynthesis